MAMHAHNAQDTARVEVRTRFGTLPVPQENLITFPEGLPGFEGLDRFALFHDDDNQSVFYLQSVDDPMVRLPVTSPHWFQVDYRIALDDAEERCLQLEPSDEIAVLVTVADTDGDPNLRINFQGPIIVNLDKRLAIQKALVGARGTLVIDAQ